MDRERLINIAVIGAGNIATRHLENLAFLGGNRIIRDRLRQVHKHQP